LMTKRGRRRKREEAKHPANERKGSRKIVSTVRTQTEQNAVQKDHATKREKIIKEQPKMTLAKQIGNWIGVNSNPIIALFTIIIALIGGLQAYIYKLQLRVARVDQRAWVEPASSSTNGKAMNIQVNGRVALPIDVINIGKTVAQNVEAKIWV